MAATNRIFPEEARYGETFAHSQSLAKKMGQRLSLRVTFMLSISATPCFPDLTRIFRTTLATMAVIDRQTSTVYTRLGHDASYLGLKIQIRLGINCLCDS